MLIGLGHKARQGKDKIADVLRTEHGFEVLHFADSLKEEVSEYFGWTPENKNVLAKDVINSENWKNVKFADGWVLVPGGVKKKESCGDPAIDQIAYRVNFGYTTLLQWWGTQFRRHCDKDYWVKKTIEKYTQNGFNDTVIADVRFRNEVDAIKKLNGNVIKVQRLDPKTRKQVLSPDRDPNHESEVDLNNYDFDFTVQLPDGAEDMAFSHVAWCIKKFCKESE